MFVSSQVKSELDIGTPRFLRTQPEQNLRVQKKNDKYDVTRSSCDSMGKASYSRSWLPSGTPIGGRLCTCCCVHFRSACHGTTQSPFSLQPYNECTTPSGDGTKGTFTRQGQKRPHRPPLVLAGSWSSAQVALFRFFEDSAFSQASLVSRRATSKFESRQGA